MKEKKIVLCQKCNTPVVYAKLVPEKGKRKMVKSCGCGLYNKNGEKVTE
jgi:hypothetical protein